jgi:glucose-1-phosphate cytidylyltransferase
VVCLGYKGYVIKEYFSNNFLHMSDLTFDMSNNSMQVHQDAAEPSRVTLVDTGGRDADGRPDQAGWRIRARRHVHADLR